MARTRGSCDYLVLVIRAISDKADGGAHMDYPTFEKKAAANSILLLNEIIKNV